MLFTTDKLPEVAIESWPELDLNPWPLNSVIDIDIDIMFYGQILEIFIVASFLITFTSEFSNFRPEKRQEFKYFNQSLSKYFFRELYLDPRTE